MLNIEANHLLRLVLYLETNNIFTEFQSVFRYHTSSKNHFPGLERLYVKPLSRRSTLGQSRVRKMADSV